MLSIMIDVDTLCPHFSTPPRNDVDTACPQNNKGRKYRLTAETATPVKKYDRKDHLAELQAHTGGKYWEKRPNGSKILNLPPKIFLKKKNWAKPSAGYLSFQYVYLHGWGHV